MGIIEKLCNDSDMEVMTWIEYLLRKNFSSFPK